VWSINRGTPGRLLHGPERPSQAIRRRRLRVTVLPNGLRLIVQEHRSGGESVAVHCGSGWGGRDEAPSERGFPRTSPSTSALQGYGEVGTGGSWTERWSAWGGRTNAATLARLNVLLHAAAVTPCRAGRRGHGGHGVQLYLRSDPSSTRARSRVSKMVARGARTTRDRFLSVRRLSRAGLLPGHPYGFPVLGDPCGTRRRHRARTLACLLQAATMSPPT